MKVVCLHFLMNRQMMLLRVSRPVTDAALAMMQLYRTRTQRIVCVEITRICKTSGLEAQRTALRYLPHS